MKKHILLLCGGNSAEHDVSLRSANFIEQQLAMLDDLMITKVEITATTWRIIPANIDVYLNSHTKSLTLIDEQNVKWQEQHILHFKLIDMVIPCIHGFPAETGDLQSLLNLLNIPYLGVGEEASRNCFNKITSKLWFDALGVKNTPYIFLTTNDELAYQQGQIALDKWGSIFIKAASQGSSYGCYNVTKMEELQSAIDAAFSYSDQVLIEQSLKPRELEVAAYEYDGVLYITKPSEIIVPQDTFYSVEEKYSKTSKTYTEVEAKNLTTRQVRYMQDTARLIFEKMSLRHLSRIDFFLTVDDQIYLNEINTFPGMTDISMFPKMLQHNGHDFTQFLKSCINDTLRAK